MSESTATAERVWRSLADIQAAVIDAGKSGDMKAVRELSREYEQTEAHEATAVAEARTAALIVHTRPLQDAFTRIIERAGPDLVEAMKVNGSGLVFRYLLPAEGSTSGPLASVAFLAGAPKKATTSGAITSGASRPGKVTDLFSMSLSEVFALVATPEEVAKVIEAGHKETRPDSAQYQIRKRVVEKAIAANHPALPTRVSAG